MMMVIATVVFSTPINWINGIGIGMVLAGGARYSQVCMNEAAARLRNPSASTK